MKAWSIKQLNEAMIEDLKVCHTELEKQLCKTVCLKEMKEAAIEFSKQRKLTPFEVAILEQHGLN